MFTKSCLFPVKCKKVGRNMDGVSLASTLKKLLMLKWNVLNAIKKSKDTVKIIKSTFLRGRNSSGEQGFRPGFKK